MARAVTEALQKAQKLINVGKLGKAEAFCMKILKRERRQPDVLHLLGIIALRNNRHARAVELYTEALQARPGHALYHYNLGLAHLRSGQFELAVEHLQRSIELDPKLTAAHSDLCLALKNAGDFETAVEVGRKAVTLEPEDAATHYNLALAYDDWQDYEASFAHYQKASQLLPDHPGLLYDLGRAYSGRGDTNSARRCFLRLIQLKPQQPEAYTSLVQITNYRSPSDEDVSKLEELLVQDHLSDDGRSGIYFALGKIYQDCGLYEEAFGYFDQGNKLQDNKFQFALEEFTAYISSLIETYTPELIAEKIAFGNNSEVPVFIVGTPRSGTTLVEQILSSHPEVFGAGELAWFGKASAGLNTYLHTTTPNPESVLELDRTSSEQLASKYLRYIHSLSAGKPRVTDKMPANFLMLGLIHILFPKARIIHSIREPRDSCVSMYCHYFPSGQPFTYDLFKLGAWYAQYRRIMAHWRSVLPAGTMTEIGYEDMVQNQEAESRRLVGFIGLEWDEACLAFHQKKRHVNTASHLQVTRPMYSSSVDRWKVYAKHLKPLEAGLNYPGRATHEGS